MPLDAAFYRSAQRRIESWTLVLGTAGAIAAALRWNGRAAAGVAVGSVLAWINFRRLKQTIAVFERLSTRQASAEQVRISKFAYVKFFGGYALLLALLCAIFFYSLLPAVTVLAGLFTLVAGVLVEGVYQLARGRPQAR